MKILVGLSGGVDSAIAAYLLQQQGHDVSCCFMRNWDSVLNNDTLGNRTLNDDICPQEQDYNDAKKVADSLGLPLYRVDFINEYWDYVFKNFISEYSAGRTPNPDILCNKYIKFDAFLKYAKENGFDKIATGHYFKSRDSRYFKADDRNKDQSYFLAQVDKAALDQCLFPLAELDKNQVRDIAQSLGLNVAKKKDSTGICFIGERDFRNFLKNYIPMKKGKVINIDTLEIIGEHEGVYYYTIGQRKGFGIGGGRGPYYCVGKNVLHNYLYLTSVKNENYLYSNKALISGINWIAKGVTDGRISCKFRYRQPDQDVYLHILSDDSAELIYPQGIKAVAPGQQAVFYLNDELLGGGIIEKTFYKEQDRNELLDRRVIEHFHG